MEFDDLHLLMGMFRQQTLRFLFRVPKKTHKDTLSVSISKGSSPTPQKKPRFLIVDSRFFLPPGVFL